jgi:hypothetical protein
LGYAVVAKNNQKSKDLESYKAWLSQKKSPTYEVTYITADPAHQGKGLAYLLLYRVLSDKLSKPEEKDAEVKLLDQSEAKGTGLYLNVGHHMEGDARVQEFKSSKNTFNEYFYRRPAT